MKEPDCLEDFLFAVNQPAVDALVGYVERGEVDDAKRIILSERFSEFEADQIIAYLQWDLGLDTIVAIDSCAYFTIQVNDANDCDTFFIETYPELEEQINKVCFNYYRQKLRKVDDTEE
jgi:hypothetical protein